MQLITDKILTWHAQFGRHDLPWQNVDAYRVWLSEIMLQQTQVTTVIPYYERFLQRFPTIADLAAAAIDDVLHLWTGLGYYARARNLHKAAQLIVAEHNGVFPTKIEQVTALPGIGKSTAGAILAFTQQQRHAILDGNVKRVLTRFYGIEGWYGQKQVESQLWELAECNTPKENVATYTQAIMDFGATFCSRSKPSCEQCVLANKCVAFTTNRVSELPSPKPKKEKPVKATQMLFITNTSGEVLLQRNPPTGIWGGLWCPPQVTIDNLQTGTSVEHQGQLLNILKIHPEYRHTFSHYHLDITPVVTEQISASQEVAEANDEVWYNINNPQKLGLAAPIKRLLETLF